MRHDLQAKYSAHANKVKFFIGDVRDLRSVANAMPGVDYIWHAAALKQVPSCDFFPLQAVKTNVKGTDNVLHAAIDAGVKRVVCLSSLESGIVFHHVVLRIDKRIAESSGAAFGHSGTFSLKTTRLINRRVKAGECKQLLRTGEAGNVPDLPENHAAVSGANTRNLHDDRALEAHDIFNLRINVGDLAIKEFNLFDRMDYLDR